MQIQQNFSLKPYNTFGIDVKARYFSPFSNVEQLTQLLSETPHHADAVGRHPDIYRRDSPFTHQ